MKTTNGVGGGTGATICMGLVVAANIFLLLDGMRLRAYNRGLISVQESHPALIREMGESEFKLGVVWCITHQYKAPDTVTNIAQMGDWLWQQRTNARSKL